MMYHDCMAKSYREKYAEVLTYYINNTHDSLKYKAALFLIDNMDGHHSPEGRQITTFKSMVDTMKTKSGIRELNRAWNEAGKYGRTTLIPDSGVVTCRMLISNIDDAFSAWTSAYWYQDVDFKTFCRYILPYRCSSEHIGGNWRKYLSVRYSSLIKDEKNIRKAFAIIKDAVYNDVVLSNTYCPYAMDAITCHKIGRAECGQRCILLVDVLRSLGIPAVIDTTPMWADYSNKSHGWVSVVWNNETYTVFENDSVAKVGNPIDASTFTTRYHVKDNDRCPYFIKKEKTPVKIYRKEYVSGYDDTFPKLNLLHDVSEQYGLNSNVSLTMGRDNDVFLCAYLSANDWMPIAVQRAVNGKVVFNHIGKNAVCTAYIEENGEKVFISRPFLVGEHGIEKTFVTDTISKEQISINRKYPLCQYTVDVWGYMRGGVFLGANSPDFSDADTLSVITSMPYGETFAKCNNSKEYRFFRYKAPDTNRSSLSELQFIVNTGNLKNTVLNGIYSAIGVDDSHLEYLYDNNTATSCRGQDTGYTITLDIGDGNRSKVDFVKFSPSTDLNFVEKGHLYELYYFDTSWNLIGRQIAREEWLTFTNVPKGALLLLKDRTKGQEERIFEYNDGIQIWH